MQRAAIAAFKPSHNATPVQTRVVVMMRSRKNWECISDVICANQGSPDEYGFGELSFMRRDTRKNRKPSACGRTAWAV